MTGTLLHILMALHTLVGAVSTACLIYLFWAAFRRHRPADDKGLVFALAWPLANLVLMAVNGWACPLQNAAQALAGSPGGWVRDIYFVPESWLRIIPWSYPISYGMGAVLVFVRGRPSRAGRASISAHDKKP